MIQRELMMHGVRVIRDTAMPMRTPEGRRLVAYDRENNVAVVSPENFKWFEDNTVLPEEQEVEVRYIDGAFTPPAHGELH